MYLSNSYASPFGILLVLLALFCHSVVQADNISPAAANSSNELEENSEPGDAVLFPWFMITIGVVVYWCLTRFTPWLPYTAVIFLIGTLMGVASVRYSSNNLLHQSTSVWWTHINGEVLLLVFLPGLIFKDASSLNVHLFQVAFWQCMITAFPMVLGGTALTALVAYGIFPYGWSFNLSMTMGAILSATDPVAVAALLDTVGAPPRLKIHIAGESLLNDGSAIVFFSIFANLFLTELGVEGLGTYIDGKTGVKLFFKKSVGAACVGVMFTIGTLALLSILNRRLSREEAVVEVAATAAMAYLCYFTADAVWGTSGVIATVTLGVLANAFAHALVIDRKLAENFWSLVDYLLNTVLFALGA